MSRVARRLRLPSEGRIQVSPDQLLKAIVKIYEQGDRRRISLREAAYSCGERGDGFVKSAASLEERGLIRIEPLPHKIRIATPTSQGLRQVQLWRRAKHDRKARLVTSSLIAFLGALLGAILTTIAGFTLWYFGLSPESTTILPVNQGNPVFVGDGWYEFEEENRYWWIQDVNRMIAAFSQSSSEPWYGEHFAEAVHATFGSRFEFATYVENTAKLSEARLMDVLVEVTRDPVPSVVNVYRDPVRRGFGAGGIFEYDVVLVYDTSPGSPKLQVLAASPSPGEDFEYVKLAPGETEAISLALWFPEPGLYTVTPILRFGFRDREFDRRFETIRVVSAESNVVWLITEGGYGQLVSYPFKVGMADGAFTIRDLPETGLETPLLFEASLIDEPCRIFILEGDNAYSPIDPNPLFECTFDAQWNEGGDRILYSLGSVRSPMKEYSFDPLTREVEELAVSARPQAQPLPSDVLEAIESLYGSPSDIEWSPTKSWTAIVIEDSLVTQNPTHSGRILIASIGTNEIAEVDAGSNLCDSPSWAPNSRMIAFICRSGSDSGYVDEYLPNEVWISDTSGVSRNLSSGQTYAFEDPAWSSDSASILVAGNGLWFFDVEGRQPTQAILEPSPDCYQCVRRPSFKP